MSTITTTIRISQELAASYDRLVDATGRSRNHLMQEALEQYAATEGWQVEEVRATLNRLEAGTLQAIPGDHLIADYLAKGWITQEGLNAARERCGLPTRERG